MSQAAVRGELGGKYEPPHNTQFSVFLDNRVGKLHALVKIFEGREPHIAALCVVDSADHAVVRLVTSKADLARSLLERHGMAFSETDILVVELNTEHTLSKLCQLLLSAELNIQYAYPLMFLPHGNTAIALQTDDLTLTAHILLKKLYTLLGENDLGSNATPSDGGPNI
ncbi:MAG: acetolactate synthase [Planctomycetes bacterium]|nr:acetolactate synthase [Planctomycetota bacterium]